MPIYEYNCHDCQEQVSFLFRSFAEVEARPPVCPHCGSNTLERVISRVVVVHTVSGGQASQDGPGGSSASDQSDPKALARSMREASQGKDLGPEFKEVANRLETGEKPVSIEKSLRKRAGQDSQTH